MNFDDYVSPDCAVCGKKYVHETVQLIGGFNTRLCVDDRNNWHEFISETNEWIDYLDILTRLKVAISNGDEGEAVTLAAALTVANEDLYRLGKKWVEERMAYDGEDE